MTLIPRGAVGRYLREIRASTDRQGTWLPGDHVEVGEIRVGRGGRTRRVGSLGQLGIAFDVDEGVVQQHLQVIRATSGRTEAAAGAGVPGVAGGEFRFEFADAGDFVFDASNLREHRLASRDAVLERVLEAAEAKTWKPKWLLVEAVYTADHATILVSQEKRGELVLQAQAPLLATASLADPRAGLTVSHRRGHIVQILAGSGVRPLFRPSKVRGSFFGELEVGPVHGTGPGGLFREATVDELLADD